MLSIFVVGLRKLKNNIIKNSLLDTPKQIVKNVQFYGEDKTAIAGSSPHLFIAVRRVNIITAQLWLEHRNKIVKNDTPEMKHYIKDDGEKKRFPVLPNKINWFIKIGKYRREQDELISKMSS